jgi:hypothetical protein
LEHVVNGRWLYGQSSSLYTRCFEKHKNLSLAVRVNEEQRLIIRTRQFKEPKTGMGARLKL